MRIKKELKEFAVLVDCVPSSVLTMFVLSVFSMNLLANKSLSLPSEYFALDCGIIVSWFTFLSMDIITKHFGVKAANELSVLALCINLLMCVIFRIGAEIPGEWGEAFVPECGGLINTALDSTFGGTWFVLLGSSIAFLVSSFVNNFTNWGIGKLLRRKPDGFFAFSIRTYASTAIGQLVDNIVFALIVSHNFFGWSLTQCFTCAVTGMAVELIFEACFSWIGFGVCRRWRERNVGKEYFAQKGASA